VRILTEFGESARRIPPMIWREMNNFSSGSVCLVLASEYYDEEDYIRDYETFKKMARRKEE
jgi:hypothetical protein